MTAVHQLLPSASPHDAITGQALAWRDLLRDWGYESEIVAEHVHPDASGTVRRLDRAGKHLVNDGSLILRYAIGSSTARTASASCSNHTIRGKAPPCGAASANRPATW